MSEQHQTRPVILFLDPDEDFLEAMREEGQNRPLDVRTVSFSSREPRVLEDLIVEHYPDIVVVNLDQDDELSFGDPITRVLHVPFPIPPIVMGVTNRDGLSLKQRAYKLGVDDYLIRPFKPLEIWLRLDVLLRIRRLQRQLDLAARKLSSMNVHLQASNRSLEEMTITDELTGLNNMRFMTQYLDKQFEVFKRYNRPFSVIMIDLDHFKEVNDQNDHLVGSETIRMVGRLIHAATRGSDIKARFGGDEYIVAMPETEAGPAMSVAERIRQAVKDCEFKGSDEEVFKITASIGVASLDLKRHDSFKALIRDADQALYVAKQQGRDQAILFEPGQTVENYDETQSSVLSELKKAGAK